jgi:hypothetical protein
MTRTEYIDFVINRLFELFPNLSDCLYSYDELSDTYFICIADKSVFDSEDFMKFSADTSLNYYESGFGGTVAFISSTEGMEYLTFQRKKNTYLIKQDLIETIFLDKTLKSTWMTAPAFSTTPFFINSLLDISNHIPNSFYAFSNDLVKNFLLPPVVPNDFWIFNAGIIGNSLLPNSESFVIEPEEDLIIVLAA